MLAEKRSYWKYQEHSSKALFLQLLSRLEQQHLWFLLIGEGGGDIPNSLGGEEVGNCVVLERSSKIGPNKEMSHTVRKSATDATVPTHTFQRPLLHLSSRFF